jgi:uncharacterized Zn ribbon protein
MGEYKNYPAFVCPECGSEMIDQHFMLSSYAAVTAFDADGNPVGWGDVTYEDFAVFSANASHLFRCLDCEHQFTEVKIVEEPEEEDEGFVDLHDFDEEMML